MAVSVEDYLVGGDVLVDAAEGQVDAVLCLAAVCG